MTTDRKGMLDKAGPGTGQVNLGGLVTMGMVVVSWTVVEYTSFTAPEYVWTAITGMLLYGVQYWHGPRK